MFIIEHASGQYIMSGHWFIVVCAYTNHKVSYMYMFEAGMHNGGHMVTEVEVGNTHGIS